jgi:hypothetical protein
MNIDLFWTRLGTDVFLGPVLRDRGLRLERAGKVLGKTSGVSGALLIFAGGRIFPNDLDPDGCMVQ